MKSKSEHIGVEVDLTDISSAQAGSKKGAHDPRLVKHIARVISGKKQDDWKSLGKDGQKPHVALAKRVLTAQKRYAAKGGAGLPDSDD